MKVSVNWLKRFVDFELPAVDELVQKIGAQLGAVEEVIDLGQKYQGIVVVKIISCEKHPDADKLKVCKIDDGGKVKDIERDENGHIQVVCGAPNVRQDMLAAWLPPGATVPSTVGKDPFALEARELRGVVSNGMLASPRELDIGDNHEGLLEIDKNATPGDDFAKLYKLDDHIIDIENKMFTHRPDCFGALGVAREVAGILLQPFKSPDWYVSNPTLSVVEGDKLKLEVKNELPELVPRFTVVCLGGVQVGPSPTWLQVALSKVGQKPINNVVDLTNFSMLVTGQPLHAYDYDKVKSLSGGEATLVVRQPKKGEKVKLLGGKEIEPRAEAIMIATDKQLIGVGGVMGGAETEVDSNTKNIILECANFDMYSIRRTSMAHGLFTDAVTRFTKGQSPLQCLAVSAKTVADIQKLAGGKVASKLIDTANPEGNLVKYCPDEIDIETSFINKLLGLHLTAEEVEKLLTNVEFWVRRDGDSLAVTAPFWRTDIEIVEDIVEEVGRLYGYDHLPLKLPKRDLTPTRKDPLLELKSNIRDQLAKAGANEVLTYSFVHGDLLDKVGQDRSQAFQISNALSPDLQYYRLSLTPSLLEKIHPNIKAGYDEFALFELGKAQVLGKEEDGLPIEFDCLSLVLAAKQSQNTAYYAAKKYFVTLLKPLGLDKPILFKPLAADGKDSATPYYAAGRSATIYIGDQIIGHIGEYKTSVRQALKLPGFCAGFEVGLAPLLKLANPINSYVPLPRFPKVTQDMTLKVAADLAYQDLFDFLWAEVQSGQPKNSHAQLNPRDIFQRESDKSHKQITFRLEIASYDRTLTDPEVNKLLDTVAVAAKSKFGAERV